MANRLLTTDEATKAVLDAMDRSGLMVCLRTATPEESDAIVKEIRAFFGAGFPNG